MRLETNLTNIALDYPPGGIPISRHGIRLDQDPMVVPKGVAAPLVVFDHDLRFEACLRKSNSRPPAPAKSSMDFHFKVCTARMLPICSASVFL